MADPSDKRTILIQLDTDDHASVFDRVVAVDAGVDEVFSHGGVTVEQTQGLVHGAMFTRGPKDLHRTAIFVGGSDVAAAEAVMRRVTQTYFGPVRVSVMFDANGCNTTAAAAVWCAGRHLELNGATALVLGGTGPVGQRAARLLARAGAAVRLGSRSVERAAEAAGRVNEAVGGEHVTGMACGDDAQVDEALRGVQVIISAGAAGVQLMSARSRRDAASLRVVIDLNAVPPAGIEGVDAMDKAAERDGVTCYGAIGAGGTKMKIHKAAIRSLFETNDRVLDAEAIFALAESAVK